MATPKFSAVEDYEAVLEASHDFEAAFSVGAEIRPGMGTEIIWHPKLGVWGHFGGWETDSTQLRLWNGFGLVDADHRRNIVVELNPYCEGKSTNYQGLVGIDGNERRVLFHRGRMSVPGGHISEDEFDRLTGRTRTPVTFGNGETLAYHRVADLDRGASVLQKQMAEFVKNCSMVRRTRSASPDVAAEEAAVLEAEVGAPELTDPYHVGPQGAQTKKRTHGKVWHALVAALKGKDIKISNARVGRWGPDLRTIEGTRILFEIKTTTSSHDVQRAVGQLLIYEVLLNDMYRKVIVIPGAIGKEAKQGLGKIGIDVLRYKNTKGKIDFVKTEMDDCLRP